MNRIVFLTLAFFAAVATAQYDDYASEDEHDFYNNEPEASSFLRKKRQMGADPDIDPFVGPEEGRQEQRERERESGSMEEGDSGEDSDETRFLPPPPLSASPIPDAIPIILPVVAQEGDGMAAPPLLPSPESQRGDFRRPSFPTTTTTTPSPPPSLPSGRPGGVFPSPSLSCSSVRCPPGARCIMENNGRGRQSDPVCVFSVDSDPTTCSQLRCSPGFECTLQPTSACPRQPCPMNPVCIQTPPPTLPPTPAPSCANVRCGPSTVCRLQADESCGVAPCPIQPTCVSPCAAVSCPVNNECKVNETTLATSCTPIVAPASCTDVRCSRGERCALVQNCSWARQCRQEAKCIRF